MSERSYHIAVLPGDGIGPEVVAQAMRSAEAAASRFGFSVGWDEQLIGGVGVDKANSPLPEQTLASCLAADAVLLGAVGGPAYDSLPSDKRPERGLLGLRKALGTFVNLRPVKVPRSLAERSPLRSHLVSGLDLLVVRELTGGIYFGRPSERVGDRALDTMVYTVPEVERVSRVAFEWARKRRGAVVSVDKANVLESSRLWRETVERVHADEFSDVTLAHQYVDNAAMQMVANPRQFDVILTTNMFGDILSDLGAALAGSLGLLPSASIGGVTGIFEPVHGSAPDIAGTGRANPLAAILSVSMMFVELGEVEAARAMDRAVDDVLDEGFRTADILDDTSTEVSTEIMGQLVATRIAARSEGMSQRYQENSRQREVTL